MTSSTCNVVASLDSGDPASSEEPGGSPDEPAARSRASTPPRQIDVELVDVTGRLTAVDVAWLCDHLARAAGIASDRDGEIRLRVVSDAEMETMHQRHCGVPGTTDVITFDLSTDERLDADLVLCIDEAARQSERRGMETSRELLLYAVHGALHCLGHDDRDPDDAAAMHRREDELLEAVGVGRVYDAPDRDRARSGETS